MLCAKQEVILGVFHLPKNSGNFGWAVNEHDFLVRLTGKLQDKVELLKM